MNVDVRFDDYAATPADLLRVLTDVGFLHDYVRALGAEVSSLTVGRDGQDHRFTDLTVQTSTRRIPALFRPLVGDVLVLRDRRTWRHTGYGYAGDVQITTIANGRRAQVRAELRLSPRGRGHTSVGCAADVDVEAPGVVADLARGAIAYLAAECLNDQDGVLRTWLQTDARALQRC